MVYHGKESPLPGLMNGAEVEVLAIELDVRDRVVLEHRKDEETSLVILQHMPPSVLVRAVGAKWILPKKLLPSLPDGFDRRGAFLVEPKISNKFKVEYGGIKYGVKRKQLPLFSAIVLKRDFQGLK